MGDGIPDPEGRIITLEYGKYYIVNCYVPNSQHSAKRHDYRAEWDDQLYEYLLELEQLKPVIICGDFNVPISDIDIYEENKWVEWNAEGFQSVERENIIRLTKAGFTDSYRYIHPDERGKFSWWSNRLNKRKENRGWRLDYAFVSEKLENKIKESTMLTEQYGSDHCPILLEMDITSDPTPADTESKVRKSRYTYSDLIELEEQHIYFGHVRQTDMTDLWDSIDWQAAEEHLQAMQTSLAKAAYARDYDRITSLQKRIVYSVDAKILAVRHVCSNAGGAGVDLIRWTTPHEKMSAALSLTSKGYTAMPARLLLVKSKNRKTRRIHIETYYDRAMQALYSYSLDPIAESWGDRKSFAYRKGRSAYDLNEYIKQAFSGAGAPEWAFIGDIRKCYEHISHDWIKKFIPLAPTVLYQFLKAGYVFAGQLYPMYEGIGIGCTLSPIIANMVLDGMQDFIYDRLYPDSNIDYANGNLIRYADDIIVAARDEETAKKIRLILHEFLEIRGLELSTEKSRIVNVHEGFTFMSRTYEMRRENMYAVPSQESIERFMENMKETIENYDGSQEKLIAMVNRKIDGWITFHKVSEADEAFRKMDAYIQGLLLELSEKKHPKWSREKIFEKYWYLGADGRHHYALPEKKEVQVKQLSDTLLVNYYHPVKTNVNPYIDVEYVESRTKERQILSVTGVYRSIWEKQEGKCYYCGKRILWDEEKVLTEVDASAVRRADRMAYVHERCLDSSLDYIDTDVPPSSITDVMTLLEQLDSKRKLVSIRYLPLSEYFRTCEKNSVTLSFKEIETIIGTKLGATARTKQFWLRTGFNTISQCWLENGYEIKALYLEDRPRVRFVVTSESKDTGSVDIPPVIRYQRIPTKAKYELENYFQYIMKKYGL